MQFVQNHKSALDWNGRVRAAGMHLGVSVAIALVAAILVFWLWYPYPYRELAGGRELFMLVVSIDVLLGPLITLAVFDRRKRRRELLLDITVVCALQLGALTYGLWTVAVARPVHLVFELDRFRVVHQIEVDDDLLRHAPASLQSLPWTGPTVVAVRPFKSNAEKFEATFAALGGVSLSARPDLWEPYDAAKPRIRAEAQPVSHLLARFPQDAGWVERELSAAGQNSRTALYLPVAGRKSIWTAVLDPVKLDVVAFLPLDSF